MLDALKFVQGAVAKTGAPEFQHLHIQNKRVTAHNGFISLSSPIPIDVTANPKAATFRKAVETCRDTVALHVTKAGRLSIRSGGFRALIDCLDNLDVSWPSGQKIEIDERLFVAIETLAPFVSTDHTRAWANSLRLSGQSAYATNNHVVVEKWLGFSLPVNVSIPLDALKEIVRIGEVPTALQLTDTNATFHYDGGRWLQCKLVQSEWPELAPILDVPAETKPVPDGFFDAVKDLAPFVDSAGRIYLLGDKIATGGGDDATASIDVPGAPESGIFNVDLLRLISKVATSFGITATKHGLFYGDNLRGVIAGMLG